jgi:hypothetical protein
MLVSLGTILLIVCPCVQQKSVLKTFGELFISPSLLNPHNLNLTALVSLKKKKILNAYIFRLSFSTDGVVLNLTLPSQYNSVTGDQNNCISLM